MILYCILYDNKKILFSCYNLICYEGKLLEINGPYAKIADVDVDDDDEATIDDVYILSNTSENLLTLI